MNELLLMAAENGVAALILAIVVYGLTRLVRNPPLAHLLWLLVLVKLIAPPVTRIEWSILSAPAPLQTVQSPLEAEMPEPNRADEREVLQSGRQPDVTEPLEDSDIAVIEPVATGITEVRTREVVTKPQAATIGVRDLWERATPIVFYGWLGGALAYAFVATIRILRFNRALGEMLPPSAELHRLVRDAADKLGVRKMPDLRRAEGIDTPLLWCLVRPTIVLPTRIVREFDNRQLSMIVAHELAHLRRHDHWVRIVELLVAMVYWWNPLVWLIRRQLHQAEELCCDAWVRWAFPEGRKRYAQTVLGVAESLSGLSIGRRLMPASPFLRSFSLKARIEMILESRFEPRVSTRSKLAVALAAALVLPTFVRLNRVDAADQDAAAHSEFPYAVKFDQGATKFLEGDKITIVEVRGTAETFKPGDIYLIKGTYTLASHDRATLAAYTTAKNAADGTGKSYAAQTTAIEKGTGTFRLFLPMACEGWPHVSFYPSDGGEGFGGNYFGTGDSVLKRWWGSKHADAPAKDDKAAKQVDGTRSLLLGELRRAKQDLRKLRDETGSLSVEDTSKFHAIALDVDEPNTWRWRLFTPKGYRYFWNIACAEIPADGVPSAGPNVISGHSNEPFWEHDNEVLVTAKLRPVGDEEWLFSVESRIGGGSKPQMFGTQMKVAAEKLRWLTESCINYDLIGLRGTEVRDPHGPIVLLRRRACARQPDGSYKPSDKPMPGFVIWLEEQPLGGASEALPPAKDDERAKQSQTRRSTRRAFGRVTDGDGRPLAGVEIWALCGGPTPRRAGIATSGDDGRYELDFTPGVGRTRGNEPSMQSTLISARKAWHFEQNLNRQGKCLAASAMPDDQQLKSWRVSKDRVVLPDEPLEVNFVMRPAGKVAGRLVDEEGEGIAGYSVSLQGPDLPPASSVVSDSRTDEQGQFVLEDVPTSFRYQIVVRKGDPKPPWDDSWASAAIRFERPQRGDLRAWFGEREIRVEKLLLRLDGPGVHGRTATRLAGNVGSLNLTADNAADVLEETDSRLALKSAVLTLSNAAGAEVRSLISESVPAPPASGFPTRLTRGRADDAGQFTLSFENPPGFDLVRGKHQVIFQIFVGASQKPIREKIFKQLDIEDGRYEVPVTIAPELLDDSRVSVTFVTIQPDHEGWVKAFFHEGKGTTYRGIWTSDGDILPAIPLAMAPQK